MGVRTEAAGFHDLVEFGSGPPMSRRRQRNHRAASPFLRGKLYPLAQTMTPKRTCRPDARMRNPHGYKQARIIEQGTSEVWKPGGPVELKADGARCDLVL